MGKAAYSIGEMKFRTGLAISTIRSWGDRYKAIQSVRTQGNQRRYSDLQLYRLKLLKKVRDGGRRISEIAHLKTEALEFLVEDREIPESQDEWNLLVRDLLVSRLKNLGSEEQELVLKLAGLEAVGNSEESMTKLRSASRHLTLLRDHPLPEAQLAQLDVTRGGALDLHRPNIVDEAAKILASLPIFRMSPAARPHRRLNALLLIQELLTEWWLKMDDCPWNLALHCHIWLEGRMGKGALSQTIESLGKLFTLEESTEEGDDFDHLPLQIWAMTLLWVANRNPAFPKLQVLYDDDPLQDTAYSEIVASLDHLWGARLKKKGPLQRLLELGDDPLIQLEWLIEEIQPEGELLTKTQRGLDELREGRVVEEEPKSSSKPNRTTTRPLGKEADWMLDSVVVAKHLLVWLHQLGVNRLDEIPESALQELKDLGFDTLWLVGLWRRSSASMKLQPGAETGSAFAPTSYRVPGELGGDDALAHLESQCDELDLKLGCDMVPNHFAVDSDWVINHPQFFVQVDECPLHEYNFHGDPIYDAGGVQIRIEDQSLGGEKPEGGRAVVFERKEGDRNRYIYHGSSGCDEPWIDTAQLNLADQEVREALSMQVVNLAKRFKMLRLSAAMLLTFEHFHRIWYPAPGEGGAVTSRSRYGVSHDEFSQKMPSEFWTEVLGRVQNEAPETMVLAETYWQMEPFFVRELGFPRVYNIQFLRVLENGNNYELQDWFRDSLKSHSSDLQHCINFLSAPSHRPAASAFGKGDRYFAVCTLLATLPGTPLFDHGQMDGHIEEYGPYLTRPEFTESPDEAFRHRHQEEILPLLKRRRLFAGVDHLKMVNFWSGKDRIRDVFALANRDDQEAVLVIINNSGTRWQGQIGLDDGGSPEEAFFSSSLVDGGLEGTDPRTGERVRLEPEHLGWSVDMRPYDTKILLFERIPAEGS